MRPQKIDLMVAEGCECHYRSSVLKVSLGNGSSSKLFVYKVRPVAGLCISDADHICNVSFLMFALLHDK